MMKAFRLLAAGTVLAGLAAGAAPGDLRQIEEGVFVEDFEHGGLDQFAPEERDRKRKASAAEVLEIAKDGGKAALHFKGRFQTRLYLQGRTLKDFAFTARMRKVSGSYAGLVVRDHWRVYLQMKCYLSLNSDAPGLQSRGQLLKSAQTFTGYHNLKVVCAGPLLHAFVDGKGVFKHKIAPGQGRIGLYAHGGGEAYYDELRVETRLPRHLYVLVEPAAPNDALVFSPDENVRLSLRASDFSGSQQSVVVSACLKTWAGKVVKEPQPQQVKAPGGEGRVVSFDMGRVASGFYRVCLRATCGGKQVCDVDDLPLAVQERGRVRKLSPPKIPVGAYYKYFSKTAPIYRKTYAHAAARSLRDSHFHAVVADPTFTRETIDIFRAYGIATISRGRFLDHPAVIATLSSDEPKPDEIDSLKAEYERLRKNTDKPITTCMVGEGIGLAGPSDPVVLWKRLRPGLRCFRWYGIKKSHYGILHDLQYKGWLPLSSVLRIAEASSETPYWFVVPALGKTHHEAYYHKPTPAQTRGMMHLALAYGADGIIFWAFQSHRGWLCFVQQNSLQPTDGNYAAAAEVAATVEKHTDLIRSLEHAGLDIRCASPLVAAVPRKNAQDGKLYVYAVNKDTRKPVSTRLLLWAETWTLTSVRDVFAARALPIRRDEEGYWSIPLSLPPGAGRLLATDAALARRKR